VVIGVVCGPGAAATMAAYSAIKASCARDSTAPGPRRARTRLIASGPERATPSSRSTQAASSPARPIPPRQWSRKCGAAAAFSAPRTCAEPAASSSSAAAGTWVSISGSWSSLGSPATSPRSGISHGVGGDGGDGGGVVDDDDDVVVVVVGPGGLHGAVLPTHTHI
jgi:hypothetical protein